MMKVAGAMRKFQKGAAKRKWKKLKLEIQVGSGRVWE
jgi:hypothetical protein